MSIFGGLKSLDVDRLELGRYFDSTNEDPSGGLGPIFLKFLVSHRGPKKIFLSKFSLDRSFNLYDSSNNLLEKSMGFSAPLLWPKSWPCFSSRGAQLLYNLIYLYAI